MKKWISTTSIAVLAALIAFGLGWRLAAPKPQTDHDHQHQTDDQAPAQIWTCSMDPQVRQPEFGACPICGMDLIVLVEDKYGPWQLALSESAQKLAEIRTAPVERQFVAREINMVGKVEYDEKQISAISAWADGRVERVYVDFTGMNVKKGDHLVDLYSPQLLSAQQEFISASQSFRQQAGQQSMRGAYRRVMAAREKLRLYGLSPSQITDLERRGAASDQLTVFSPVSGVVIDKHVVLGQYIKEGDPIYTVADLSRVWVKLDAYEDDLAWLRYGQDVEFYTHAYPGETFAGKIVFIDPVLDPKTRTVKVRLNVENPNGKLKPDMFIRAVVYAKLGGEGSVVPEELKGKWISPMHPEVVKDGPGQCDVCGMDLVPAEQLGLTGESQGAALVIPVSAALVTGQRAVVYVKTPGDEGVFEGREIVLGPRTRDYFVVREGLQEGDIVVTNGAFKIDSELQIRAKKSMMYHESEAEAPQPEMVMNMEVNEDFRGSLAPVLAAYFKLQTALSEDDERLARSQAHEVKEAIDRVQAGKLKAKALTLWTRTAKDIYASAELLLRAGNIEDARVHFEPLSHDITLMIQRFNPGGAIYRFHCPMAFDDRGAFWLQDNDQLANPYFGASMYRCGRKVEMITAKEQHNHDH